MQASDQTKEELLVELEGLCQRITELQKSEADRDLAMQELSQRESYFASLLFSMDEDIMVIGENYRITDVNKAFLVTLGRKQEDVVGRPCYEVSHGYDEPCEKRGQPCVLQEVFKTGQARSCRHQHIHADGSKVWVDLVFSPLRDKKGNVARVIETMRDVTNLVKMEEALLESEQKFRALFDHMPTIAFVINRDHRLIACNRTFVDIMDDQVGKETLELSGASRSLRQFWFAVEKQLIESQEPTWYIETVNTAKRGQIYLDKRMQPVKDDSGNVSMVIGIATDITNEVKRQIALAEEVKELRVQISREAGPTIVGTSRAVVEVFNRIKAIADTDTTVFITGESGTGKDLVAEAIHNVSKRSKGPLIKVTCAALPETIIESELFGHVKGAFSGAVSTRLGRFEAANGGTIFLDEIADISPAVQQRLLRVLDEKKIEKVGDYRPIKVDVRIIAATNQTLEDLVAKGRFRQDLYYRLNVFRIHVPPLRERSDDVPLLVGHFLSVFSKVMRKKISSVSNDVMNLFLHHKWPGNIRELMNVIESACVLCQGKTIQLEHLPPLFEPWSTRVEKGTEMEIREALRRTRGNKAEAARMLGIARRTLYRRIERYRIVSSATE
jgi:PAS domain S-box-containing protein